MALEQLRAFRAGQPQESLGAVERVLPEGFPLLAASELRAEHKIVSAMLPVLNGIGASNLAAPKVDEEPIFQVPDVRGVVEGVARKPAAGARLVLALLERTFAY